MRYCDQSDLKRGLFLISIDIEELFLQIRNFEGTCIPVGLAGGAYNFISSKFSVYLEKPSIRSA